MEDLPLQAELDQLGWDDVLDLLLVVENGEALEWALTIGEEEQPAE
jgi:hypothetical protein